MALARHFAEDTANLVTIISPQAFHFAHAKALARAMMRDTDINWEFLFTSVWATVLRGSWAQALIGYYKVRDSDRGDLKLLTDFVNDVVEPGSVPEQRLSQYMKQAAEIISSSSRDVVGDIQSLLQSIRSERIAPSIRRVSEASNVKLITLVDSLDENWDGSNTSAQMISGLLTQCAADHPPTGAVSYPTAQRMD